MSDIVSFTAEPLDLPLSEPFEISLGTQHEAANVLGGDLLEEPSSTV